MRKHGTSLRRKKATRNPKRKFVLFSEGANTERVYFEALERHFSNALIEVEFIGPAGAPVSIAQKVKERMVALKRERKANSFAENDTVWAVFDEDEHRHVKQSIAQCEAAGAAVAYSNPCFEVWLILHHQDFDKADDRHQVQKRMKECDPKYDPDGPKIPNCQQLMENIEAAEERAITLEIRRVEEGSPLGRPCSTVYKLTQAVRIAAESDMTSE